MSEVRGHSASGRRWLVFTIEGRDYALEPADVREVHAGLRPTPLAGTVDWFLGTSTLRGQVVPVTALMRWLGAGACESGAAIGIEIAVQGRSYLLAVPEVHEAQEDDVADDDVVDPARQPENASALAARGVRSVRRRIGGRVVECFSACALVSCSAFSAIAAPA